MKTLGQKLKEIRLQNDLSMDELTERLNRKYELNISKSMVSRWENNKSEPLNTYLSAYAKEFNQDMNYLLGINDSPSDDIDISQIPGVIMPVKLKRIPILGTIACGEPLFAEQNYEGYFMLDENLHGADFCLKAKGDSMIEANIFEKDLVFFKKTSDVDNGAIAAVLIDDEATLKRISKSEDMLVLQPCNRSYSPIIIKPEDNKRVLILGEMVGVYSERNR